jgi:DNA-binding NtrC family response regulator
VLLSRILVVDEDSGNRVILKSRLTSCGYEITQADSGARGLVAARANHHDLILVASVLSSGIDGCEVCRRLKGIPETNQVPVVLFHHQTPTAEELQRAYDAGCDGYIARAELPTLEHVLRLLLKQRREVVTMAAELRVHHERLQRGAEERVPNVQSPAGATSNNGDHASALREIASGRPEGVLVVDAEGLVRHADRGACEILGNRLEGRHLASLTPASRLEAFVRDARIEPREGFRFDLAARKGHAPRSITATVIPLVAHPGEHDPGLRIVLFCDALKRRLAAEASRATSSGLARHELGALLEAAREMFQPESLIGASPAAEQLRQAVVQASQSAEPVLIEGARGSGKERVARTIHYSGSSTGAFLQVRCSAISPENLERELFGCAKGSVPGSQCDVPGLFHLAQDGTLFLEDLTDVPKPVQERLQLFLEQGTLYRQGSTRAERIDVRLIASTTVPLDGAVAEDRLSSALVTRFQRTHIRVPTLAERPEDIELLAAHFLARYGSRRGVREIADGALWLLRKHSWPDNVGELEDCIEQGSARASGGVLNIDDLPRALRDLYEDLPGHDLIPMRRPSGPTAQGTHTVPPRRPAVDPRAANPWDINEEDPISLDVYEKKVLLRALNHVGGDKLAAARLLQLGKSTLYRKLKRFGIP